MGFFNRLFSKKNITNGYKILVVDDNEIDRKIVASALIKAGYTVVTATNGEEGFKMVTSDPPDLIVLDCEMPEMSGVELCNKVKESDQYGQIPVIFLTSFDAPRNILDCFEADAENFLTKPLQPKLLIKEISKSLPVKK